MKHLLTVLITIALAASALLAAQVAPDAQRTLRAQLEEKYDIVPLSEGIALRPKAPKGDVRLIEVSDNVIAVNGITVTGGELRERIGADADVILRLSYLDAAGRRAIVGEVRDSPSPSASADCTTDTSAGMQPDQRRRQRSSGDRVRVFGNVTVGEDEDVSGQAVAVLGSVRIDGQVRDQVVAVLGSVDLGPRAAVHGDVVAVGGHVNRAQGARIDGTVTEVALGSPGARVSMSPWVAGWGPLFLSGTFGAAARLVGTLFRFVLLALLACIVFVVARPVVESSAQRVHDDPVRSVLVGLITEVMLIPVFIMTAIVLAISIIGIPLLLLLPFAALLMILVAITGFAGTAYAVGQRAHRRFGGSTHAPVFEVIAGVFVILLPLLIGRTIALAGWLASPVAILFVAIGFIVEVLAWAIGLGAVLTNGFTRWQARRATRRPVVGAAPGTGSV